MGGWMDNPTYTTPVLIVLKHCFLSRMSWDGFAIQPHEDCSAVCETVTFLCREAPPKGEPNGWIFTFAGFLVMLPEVVDEVLTIYLDGQDLMHGTLPAPYHHDNCGSALVSKESTLHIFKGHQEGCPKQRNRPR